MLILINALFLKPGRVGGTETYLRALIASIARIDTDNQYIVCLGREATGGFGDLPRSWRILASPTVSANRPARLALEQTWLPGIARRLGVDVIHSAGYTSPLVSNGGRLTTIHDMNYRRHPEDMSALEIGRAHV